MTPLEHLIAARAKIEKPENWTTDYGARDSNGQFVGVRSTEAVCWCAYGALRAADLEMLTSRRDTESYLDKAVGTCFDGYIDYNDTHTHEEVLAMFDRAIELARADEEGKK